MSELQQEAVQMITSMSEDNLSFLMEVIRRLIPYGETKAAKPTQPKENRGLAAFGKLLDARREIWQYLPEDFDPDKELEKARAERYGDIG